MCRCSRHRKLCTSFIVGFPGESPRDQIFEALSSKEIRLGLGRLQPFDEALLDAKVPKRTIEARKRRLM